ncbi:MAG: hypothetical protein ACM37Z_20920, partial [Deltaproteobacteria bacterium]
RVPSDQADKHENIVPRIDMLSSEKRKGTLQLHLKNTDLEESSRRAAAPHFLAQHSRSPILVPSDL